MRIIEFLNPIQEQIDDGDKDIVEQIISCHESEREHETDEKKVKLVYIKETETLAALSLLRLYEKQQKDDDDEVISLLHRQERVIRSKGSKSTHQTTLDSWFG